MSAANAESAAAWIWSDSGRVAARTIAAGRVVATTSRSVSIGVSAPRNTTRRPRRPATMPEHDQRQVVLFSRRTREGPPSAPISGTVRASPNSQPREEVATRSAPVRPTPRPAATDHPSGAGTAAPRPVTGSRRRRSRANARRPRSRLRHRTDRAPLQRRRKLTHQRAIKRHRSRRQPRPPWRPPRRPRVLGPSTRSSPGRGPRPPASRAGTRRADREGSSRP